MHYIITAMLVVSLTACSQASVMSGPVATATSTPPPQIAAAVSLTATPILLPDTPVSTIPPQPTATPTPTPLLSAITPETVGAIRRVFSLEGHKGPVLGVAVSPDGRLVASASADGQVRLFDGRDGSLLHVLERHRDMVHCVAFSSDGRYLVSGSRDRTVQIWDPMTGQRIIGARMSGEVFNLSFAPNGPRFAAVGLYSAVGEVRDTNGAALFSLEGHHTRLRSVAYAEHWLATGDADGLILLHDPDNGQLIGELGHAEGEILTMAASPDGNFLAVGLAQHLIQVWDVTEQQLVLSWVAHSNQVWGLVYSPDGRLIISGGADGAVRLWSASSGERLGSLTGHGAAVRSVAIAGDGAILVSGSEDNRAFVWRVVP